MVIATLDRTASLVRDSKLVRGKKIMGSDEVARIGYAALMKGKRVVVPGAKNRFLANSVRFMPRNMVARAVMKAQARRPSGTRALYHQPSGTASMSVLASVSGSPRGTRKAISATRRSWTRRRTP